MADYVEVIRGGQRTAYLDGAKGIYDGKIKNRNTRYGRNAVANFREYCSFRMPKPPEIPDLSNISKLSDDEFEKTLASLDKVLDESKNAVETLPPLAVTLKYMPGKPNYLSLNSQALLGTAFEEMGKKIRVSTQEMTNNLRKAFEPYKPVDISKLTEQERKILGELPSPKSTDTSKISADALDINEDGYVDIAEYASSILASDILSKTKHTFADFSPDKIDGTVTDEGMTRLLSFFNMKNKTTARQIFTNLHSFFNLDLHEHKFVGDADNIQQ